MTTKHKERPILFSGAMVRAILAGNKSQTRRVVKPQPPSDINLKTITTLSSGYVYAADYSKLTPILADQQRIRWDCPHGQPGDRLWVREAWRTTGDGGRVDYLPPRDLQPHDVWYEADGSAPGDELTGKLRPSMFMPRWASRILLELTDVRVQRLQDVSEVDALAEGVEAGKYAGLDRACARAYSDLWEQINGPDSWSANPWVWAITFTRLT